VFTDKLALLFTSAGFRGGRGGFQSGGFGRGGQSWLVLLVFFFLFFSSFRFSCCVSLLPCVSCAGSYGGGYSDYSGGEFSVLNSVELLAFKLAYPPDFILLTRFLFLRLLLSGGGYGQRQNYSGGRGGAGYGGQQYSSEKALALVIIAPTFFLLFSLVSCLCLSLTSFACAICRLPESNQPRPHLQLRQLGRLRRRQHLRQSVTFCVVSRDFFLICSRLFVVEFVSPACPRVPWALVLFHKCSRPAGCESFVSEASAWCLSASAS